MSSRTPARRRAFATVVAAACVAAVALLPAGANAAIVATVPLGTTSSYAVLAGSTVTNTGASVLGGNLGVAPGTSVTGFPPGLVLAPGTIHKADGPATQAQSDLTVAYDNAAGRPLDATTAADLGNLTLQGGVYAGPGKGALALTGPLTLDGAGNANSVFIFQTTSSLTTASGSTVNLINGAQPCNVFWQVGSSATLGTNSVFVGNILALTSITVTTGVTVQGRALARNGAVTLDTDTFSPTACAAATTTTTSAPGTTTTAKPTTTTTTTAAPTTTTTTPRATTPTTTPVAGTPVSGPVAGEPVAGPVAGEPVAGTPDAGSPPANPVGGPIAGAGGPAAPAGAAAPASPSGPTAGGGTGTATPTGRITTSVAGPGSPTGGLARTGSALDLTFLVGLAMVVLGAGAVRLGRTS